MGVPRHRASRPDPETRAALRHLVSVAATLACMVALTYVVPSFERFQPWVPGEPLPLADLLEPRDEVPAFAGAGSAYQSPSGEGAEAEGAAGAGRSHRAEAGSHTPRPHLEGEGPEDLVVPSDYGDVEVPIVDPTGEGMRPFYEALYRTALGRPGAITRVAQYGDSSIATDLITHTVRRRLQERFGDAGHGFILVSRGHLPYRHRDVSHSASNNWQLREVVRSQDRDGYYGYGGVSFQGKPGAWARVGTDEDAPVGGRVSRFDIYYMKHPRGGDLLLRVDGGPRRTLRTRSEETTDAVESIRVPDGPHRLELRFGGRGRTRVYGVVLEREGPGVVYDSLGLVGARANRLLNFDPEHIAREIGMRDVDLLVLGFGGNEADDTIHPDSYLADYEAVIDRMRAGREDMGCLVFAPLDQGERNRWGRIVTMPNIPVIVEAQRRAAESRGCAFFDTFAAMGGEGAMGRWNRARPRLGMSDYRHATPAGYEILGDLLYRALMKGFDDYLEANADTLRDLARETAAERGAAATEVGPTSDGAG